MINPIKTQVIARINKLTGEEIETPKQYLVLLFFDNTENDDEEKTFEIIDGKENTFIYLVQLINGETNVNLLNSRIMSSSLPLDKSITLYSIIRYWLETNEKFAEMALNQFEFTLEVLNDCVSYVYNDELKEVKDLDTFYNKEINQEID